MKNYYSLIKREKFLLIILFMITVVTQGLSLAIIYYNGILIDSFFENSILFYMLLPAIIYCSLVLFGQIFGWAYLVINPYLKQKIIFNFQKHLIFHLQKVNLSEHKKFEPSYLAKRIEDDATQISNFFVENYSLFFIKIIEIIVILIILFNANFYVGVAVVVATPVYFIINKLFQKSVVNSNRELREETAQFFKGYSHQIEHIEDIILESDFEKEKKILSIQFENFLKKLKKERMIRSNLYVSGQACSIVLHFVVLTVGAIGILNGTSTVGIIIVSNYYFSRILQDIQFYTDFLKSYQITKASIKRIDELLEIPQVIEGEKKINSINSIKANINYTIEDKKIINNQNITAKKGSVIVIIGKNGIGKTTILKIISGALKVNDIEDTYIKINDNINIKDIDTNYLRFNNFSYIPQKINFRDIDVSTYFSDYNDISQAKFIKTLKDTITISEHIENIITKNWNTNLKELSGGEKQLICILYNILKNKDVLIFDEPTSNLDTNLLEWFVNMIHEIKKDKIIFIITHEKFIQNSFENVVEIKHSKSLYENKLIKPKDLIFYDYFKHMSNDSDYFEENIIFKENYFVLNNKDKWEKYEDDTYIFLKPKEIELETQGFKIHISTLYKNGQKTLDIVSSYLFLENIPFKYIKSLEKLRISLSKNANRIQAGKFITIYPKNKFFVSILENLYLLLKELPKAVYIITDKQYKDSNIFYRYGAFKEILNDDNISCIFDDKGNLIPDNREPFYHLPDFITEPKELQDFDTYDDSNNENEITPLDNYTIQKALTFTVSGGIYLATKNNNYEDNKYYILKEARTGVGLDMFNREAKERLYSEYETLKKLSSVDGVVNVVEYFSVWESDFLVEEYIEGITLDYWIYDNFPFLFSENLDMYTQKIKYIIKNLKNILENIHLLNLAICDLHPSNIIVRPDLSIVIIDFESSISADLDDFKLTVKTTGFHSDLIKNPKEQDWYSFLRIIHKLFVPIPPIYDIENSITNKYYRFIKNIYNKDDYNYFKDISKNTLSNISNYYEILDVRNVDENIRNYDNEFKIELVEKLKKSIIKNLDFNSDSLIKGDILSLYTDCGKYNLMNGGFGAILALYKVDKDILTKDFDYWIKKSVKHILGFNYNNGYFSGRLGIASALYFMDYKKEALDIVDKALGEIDIQNNDLSLGSGLAGIGLAILQIGIEENSKEMINKAIIIADSLITQIKDRKYINGIYTHAKKESVGLLAGYSGVSIFLCSVYKINKNEEYINFSIELIKNDLDNCLIEKDILVYDEETKTNSPYLGSGSMGIFLSINFLNEITKKNYFEDFYLKFKNTLKSRIFKNAGFFVGASGFLIFKKLFGKESEKSIYSIIDLFLIEKDGLYYVPSDGGLKLSFDIMSGNSGILLGVLSDTIDNPFYFFPLHL
ncbi:MAG: class III lanthionine synthetase LanKC [Defluviitaleaceae bacterium]|nr:class III lanthionine synthetase LanKC [Defluviitaleaceae bacterium]